MTLECDACGITPADLPDGVDPDLVFETDDDGVTRCMGHAAPAQCSCYDPASMEYGPNYPCPRCQVIETGGTA